MGYSCCTPTRLLCHRTSIFRILALLLLSTSRSASFAPSSTPAFRAAATAAAAARGRSFVVTLTRTGTELSVASTADAEEIHKPKNSSDASSASSWTPVLGGFLPNYKPATRQGGANKAGGVQEVSSLSEYKTTVVDEPDRITVVRFYAPWCRACKAVKSKFHRLSRLYDSSRVQFVEVPLTKENAVLHTGLGVPSLPYGHIYHPTAGLVEEMKINKKMFAEFEEILDTYVQGYCNVAYTDDHSGNHLML